MLARVTGYRAALLCAARCRPLAARLLINAARPVGVARSVSGRRRRGRRWYGFLGLPSAEIGSASPAQQKQRCSPFFEMCKGALRSDAAGDLADFTAVLPAATPENACCCVAHAGVCPVFSARSEGLFCDDRNTGA